MRPPPRTRAGTEAALTEAWVEILGRKGAPHDDFYSLGGNSFRAVQLITAVEPVLGIEFPIDLLFSDGSLTTLVDACWQRRRAARADD